MDRLVDCTVISNFAAAGCLPLLRDVAGPLHLASEVYDEILGGRLSGYDFYDGIEQHISPLSQSGWLYLVAMTEDELRLSAELPSTLHRGEGACLCMARQRGWGLLTDDRAARKQAVRWGISVSGTLGVLLLGVQVKRITVEEGNAILGSMVDRANYRSPVADLRALIST